MCGSFLCLFEPQKGKESESPSLMKQVNSGSTFLMLHSYSLECSMWPQGQGMDPQLPDSLSNVGPAWKDRATIEENKKLPIG